MDMKIFKNWTDFFVILDLKWVFQAHDENLSAFVIVSFENANLNKIKQFRHKICKI